MNSPWRCRSCTEEMVVFSTLKELVKHRFETHGPAKKGRPKGIPYKPVKSHNPKLDEPMPWPEDYVKITPEHVFARGNGDSGCLSFPLVKKTGEQR